MSLQGYILRRLGLAGLTLLGVSFLAFVIIHLIPGDPARILAGVEATEEEVNSLRQRLGLDRPLPTQYRMYLQRTVQGDLGRSLRTGRRVTTEIAARLSVTALLAFTAFTVTVAVGVSVGVFAGVGRKHLAKTLYFLILAVSCMPVFWTGMMLVLVFALRYRVLPPGGSSSFAHFILPAVALGLNGSGLVARVVRGGMEDVMDRAYIITARAKGISRVTVIFKHALRNTLIPVVTLLGLQLGQLLGGAILTETLFALNGIGRYLVISIAFRDYPVVQGIVLFMAATFLGLNLVVDILYGVIDPRVRYS